SDAKKNPPPGGFFLCLASVSSHERFDLVCFGGLLLGCSRIYLRGFQKQLEPCYPNRE
ncbi:MAG: hypothetical protein ACI91G_001530, partial [Gammaproteobacteria bacterium]